MTYKMMAGMKVGDFLWLIETALCLTTTQIMGAKTYEEGRLSAEIKTLTFVHVRSICWV